MATHRWLGLSFVIAIAAAFSACSSNKQSTTTTSSGGGLGGAGGASTSTTSSVGTGGEKADGGVVDAGPIVCPSTTYSTVPEGGCDILQQDCPAGKTCAPTQSGSAVLTECGGNTGLKTTGESCYNPGDCDAKLFCVSNKCTPVCCRDNNEPCNGGICNINVAFGDYNVFVCHFAPKCELFAADACPTGLACHIEDVSQGLATCGEPDPNNPTSPDLGSCKFLNDCATMEQCYAGDNVCHYFCRLSGGTDEAAGLGGCPAGQLCQSTYGGQAIDFGVPGVGLCFADN